MQYTSTILCAAFAVTSVMSHALITEVKGANAVTMPGLTVTDGTPRDCPSAGCGAQSDTSIIRTNELGTAKASALGRTKNDGPVDAAKMMAVFMDGSAANVTAREIHENNNLYKRQLGKLFGGGAGGAGGATDPGVKTPAGTKETGVAAAAGLGASEGLPTASDSGEITMTIHQCNQDGAGPFDAQIDNTSGGTDPAAFKTAQVTQNVPGIAAGFSAATTTDYQVKVQMPAGMTCSGTVGAATDVCIVRMSNKTPAGPFGGAGAFTQSPGAKKRAIEYNLSKRRMARSLQNKKN
ncbi:hypothetical protein ONS95_006943 [Cadophora gregata]|uniref:uncharacterized protein n=1 Tax=Cadophora gregata TaxID=51156 RepID=UPI0026DB1AF8|nr:uncharacterized protein ONS95_006943 [Cadophora gregata]KAK0101793.1 hypothetical protein ONS95_006943 [Cadophora gregata]KAK0106192.1 hypothetical protein ONS96_003836 [Cadophora gregata f. sp. sojae]